MAQKKKRKINKRNAQVKRMLSTKDEERAINRISKIKDPVQRINEFKSLYHTLAMRADRRLIAIEKNTDPSYNKMSAFAYNMARTMIKGQFGDYTGKMRFDKKTQLKKNATALDKINYERQIKSQLKDVLRFLSAPTSSKMAIQNLYEKKARKLSRTLHTKVDWEDMAEYFESEVWENRKSYGPSDVVLRAMMIIKKKVPKDLENFNEFYKDKRLKMKETDWSKFFDDSDSFMDSFENATSLMDKFEESNKRWFGDPSEDQEDTKGKKKPKSWAERFDSIDERKKKQYDNYLKQKKFSKDPQVQQMVYKLLNNGVKPSDIRKQP